jgi:magnesium transporter
VRGKDHEMSSPEPVVSPAEQTRNARNEHIPRSYYRDADGTLTRDLSLEELAAALSSDRGQLWVDVDSRNLEQHQVLAKLFHFHPLAIEDTLNPQTRVKVEEYKEYLFINVRVVRFCEETPDDPYDLETFNLYLFLGKNLLVTVHAEPSPSVAGVADLVVRSPDILGRGAARVAHMVLDSAIDAYFPILDQLDEFVDGLEARVFGKFDESVLHEIFSVKRMVITLRRYLAPQREVFNILTNRPSAMLPQEMQLYFRDIYDHMLRITESLDNFRELLTSTLDSYLSQVSNRLGMVTKGLAVVATLSVPFVVIAGIYGMNFQRIPLASHPYGFWILVVLQLGIGLSMLSFLRWRRWL